MIGEVTLVINHTPGVNQSDINSEEKYELDSSWLRFIKTAFWGKT